MISEHNKVTVDMLELFFNRPFNRTSLNTKKILFSISFCYIYWKDLFARMSFP